MARSYNYIVNYKDIDFSRRASLITICDYVIQTAGEDADASNFGVDFLLSNSMAWVLSRMSLEVYRYPNRLEPFRIETWVEKVDKVIVTRHFNIYDNDNTLIGSATTYWSIINFVTRRMEDCRQYNDFRSSEEPISSPIAPPLRIRAFAGEQVSKTKVKYSQIDFNQHTNTTKYIGWMLNSLPLDWYLENEPLRLDVNFLSESRYDDTVITYNKKEESNNAHLFMLNNEATAKQLCTARIAWKTRNK